jgi:hypothetical protein
LENKFPYDSCDKRELIENELLCENIKKKL